MGKKLKFRDEQVAEDIAKKAELGWMDVEFMMYGCAYLDPAMDKVFYKISSREEDIYEFMRSSKGYGFYPSRMMILKQRYAVPTGAKEYITQKVKLQLAHMLQDAYPKEFFYLLYQFAEENTCDSAASWLWKKAETLEDGLDGFQLICFARELEYYFYCHMLTKESYHQLQHWLKNEIKNLGEHSIEKDKYEKTIYGIAYIEGDRIKYLSDVQQNVVYRKLFSLEERGCVFTPIYKNTYWYSSCNGSFEIISGFKTELQKYFKMEYLYEIITIRNAAKRVTAKETFQDIIAESKIKYGEHAAVTLKSYGNRWGIL